MKKTGIVLMSFLLIGAMSCKEGKKCCGKEEKCTQQAVVETPKKMKKVVVARVTIKQGQEKAFIDVASKLVDATRKESGNLFYTLYQSPTNPVEFIFYEEYKDEAAFQTHASSAHFAVFAEGIKNMTSGELIVDQF